MICRMKCRLSLWKICRGLHDKPVIALLNCLTRSTTWDTSSALNLLAFSAARSHDAHNSIET